MENPEQNFVALGMSATETQQELLSSRILSGWDMHPTFLSDAELLGASCVILPQHKLTCLYRALTSSNQARRSRASVLQQHKT